MFRYINFLNKTMIRKKAIWITAIIGFALFCLLTFYEIKDANQANGDIPGITKINNLTSFDFFIPFVFGTLVSAFIVMHCFKEGESDGTELIIVAKPLTRAQIIAGKFLTTILFLIAYQFACMIIYILMSTLDDKALASDKINFVLSLTIGGFIIQLFAVGIITLLASLLSKIGTIVISVMFAALIPIIHFIAVPIAGGYEGNTHIRNANHSPMYFITGYDDQTKKYLSMPVNSIYKRDIVDAKKDEEKNNYDFISKIDPWYQWGRFYSLFIKRPSIENNPSANVNLVNWHVKKTVVPNVSTFPIMIDEIEEKFAFQMNKNAWDDIKNIPISNDISYLANNFWNNGWKIYNGYIDSITGDSGAPTIDKTTQAKFQEAFRKKSWNEKYNNIFSILVDNNKSEPNPITPALIIRYLEKHKNIPLSKAHSTKSNVQNNSAASLPYEMINVNDIYTIETSDYIPTQGVVVIWTIIGLLLLGASAFVYTKRDFK